MSELERYEALQEYNNFEMLVNTVEIVNKEEYDFIIGYDSTEKENFTYVEDAKWLNLNVYSEHDHEKRQYEMEVN